MCLSDKFGDYSIHGTHSIQLRFDNSKLKLDQLGDRARPFASRRCVGLSRKVMGFQQVSANNSRPISMRLISLVPAPISYSLASRHRRPSG